MAGLESNGSRHFREAAAEAAHLCTKLEAAEAAVEELRAELDLVQGSCGGGGASEEQRKEAAEKLGRELHASMAAAGLLVRRLPDLPKREVSGLSLRPQRRWPHNASTCQFNMPVAASWGSLGVGRQGALALELA